METFKKTLNRRQFLKHAGTLVIGIFALRLKGLFASKNKAKISSLKEAKYYRRADNLAG